MRNTILKIYILTSVLLLADMGLYYFYKISLRGYYSDMVLFWFWFFGSVTIVIMFWKKIWAKLFLAMMVLSLILSILPMAIPFFAFILSTTPFGLWLDKNLNQRYRAQIVGYSAMAPPVLQVIEKKGGFEKQVFQCDDSQLLSDTPEIKIRQAKDIIFDQETDTTLTLTLFYGGPNKRLTFNKASGKIIEGMTR